MDKNAKQVLITGGAGYVGQVLLDEMPNHWKATVIDNVYVGNNNFHPSGNIEFVNGDIRNESLMEKLIAKNDAVIHLAGIVGDSCPNNPESAGKINVNATEKNGVPREAGRSGQPRVHLGMSSHDRFARVVPPRG